jgi:1-acyl-sn-glycerol-3-phosphate acyltransferase
VWKVFFGIEIKGRENIPESGGLIIAPNHLSNFDPVLLGAAIWKRESYFFAKSELFEIVKFYTWLIRYFNAFKVNIRGIDRSALRYTSELLKNGLCVVMFLEGTRSRVGDFLSPKEGVAYVAIRNRVPIIPTLIEETNTPLWRQFIGKTRVRIIFGQKISTERLSTGREESQKLAEEIMKVIRGMRDER